MKLEIVQLKANLPYQLNVGLEYIESSIVMFPDDDSFYWPGVAESILRIYERDKEKIIGGVCAAHETRLPPTLSEKDFPFRIKTYDKFSQKYGSRRVRFENKFFPNPKYVLGNYLQRDYMPFSWLEEENAVVVPHMTGFCMTFRSEAIKKKGFSPELGKLIGWTGGEDTEACFSVMKDYILVGTHNARVCHYKFPTKRAVSGIKLGFTVLFNQAYMICKHCSPGSEPRQSIRKWALYKIILYCGGIKNKYGRDRLRGILKAYKMMNSLINEPTERVKSIYINTINKIIEDDLLD